VQILSPTKGRGREGKRPFRMGGGAVDFQNGKKNVRGGKGGPFVAKAGVDGPDRGSVIRVGRGRGKGGDDVGGPGQAPAMGLGAGIFGPFFARG